MPRRLSTLMGIRDRRGQRTGTASPGRIPPYALMGIFVVMAGSVS